MSFGYIASPYSHPDAAVRHDRYLMVLRYCANALKDHHWVYSPIVHCHEMALLHKLPTDARFWERYNFAMLDACKALEILMLPGWVESKGVRGEMLYAQAYGIPIHHIDPKHKWLLAPALTQA